VVPLTSQSTTACRRQLVITRFPVIVGGAPFRPNFAVELQSPEGRIEGSLAQAPNVETTPTIVVRTAIDPAAMTSTLRAVVSATDQLVPMDRIRTMDQLVYASVGQPRFRTYLLLALSMLALIMASVGVYGVANYTVVQRTREFGICLAVGATAGDVLRLVLARTAVLILAGLIVGLLASLGLTRLIAGLLYGVAPLDLPTFAAVSLLLFTVASLASYLPARRATRIDPMVALRYE
jgi:putative ABC transport system permease protein